MKCWLRGWRGSLFGMVMFTLVAGGILAVSHRTVFWSPDEGIRFIMARYFSEPDQGVYPNMQTEALAQFAPWVWNSNQIMYPIPRAGEPVQFPWNPLFAQAAGFLYDWMGIDGLYWIPFIASVFCVGLMGLVFPENSFAVTVLVGFVTPVFFYSQVFWDHTLITLLCVISSGLTVVATARDRWDRRTWVCMIVAFSASILACVLRVEAVAFFLALLCSWGWAFKGHWSSRQWIVLGGSVIVLTLIGIFVLPLRYMVEIQTRIEDFQPEQLMVLIKNAIALLVHVPSGVSLPLSGKLIGTVMAAVFIGWLAPLLPNWKWESVLLGLALFYVLVFEWLVLTAPRSYSALHGVLETAPYIILGGYALRSHDIKVRLSARLCALYLLLEVCIIIVLRGADPAGLAVGFEWGPRYLLPLFPLLVALVIPVTMSMWQSKRPLLVRQGWVAFAITLLLLSGALQIRGLWMLNHSRETLWNTCQEIRASGARAVVTDQWWVPASYAGCIEAIYSVTSSTELMGRQQELPVSSYPLAWVGSVIEGSDSLPQSGLHIKVIEGAP